MAAVVGGSGFLCVLSLQRREACAEKRIPALFFFAITYERIFWGALGVLVMTGVSNMAAFGVGLPLPASNWGQKLTLKLSLVLVLVLLSLVRTMVVSQLSAQGDGTVSLREWRI